ncbi:MAG: ribokinase [Pseudomonadota bacterium]
MAGRIIVFGSINLDIVTTVARRPVAGETIAGENCLLLPGGKGANQALAAQSAARKDQEVHMIGAVGRDAFAPIALSNLNKSGVDLTRVVETDAITGTAIIMVDADGENIIVINAGANALASADQIKNVSFKVGDVLLTQQELTLEEVLVAHKRARLSGGIVVHNAAPAYPLSQSQLANIDYLIVNETEVLAIADAHGFQSSDPEMAAKSLSQTLSLNTVLTLGADGAIMCFGEEIDHVSAPEVDVKDTTGAGDVFCGTFAAQIAQGTAPRQAVKLSVEAASAACTWFGAQQT